jgi:hypothetical protein
MLEFRKISSGEFVRVAGRTLRGEKRAWHRLGTKNANKIIAQDLIKGETMSVRDVRGLGFTTRRRRGDLQIYVRGYRPVGSPLAQIAIASAMVNKNKLPPGLVRRRRNDGKILSIRNGKIYAKKPEDRVFRPLHKAKQEAAAAAFRGLRQRRPGRQSRPIDPYSAKGSVEWKTNGKKSIYTVTAVNEADDLLLKKIIENPSSVDKKRLPAGYKKFLALNEVATLGSKILMAKNQANTKSFTVETNVFSGEELGEVEEVEFAPMRAGNPLPLAHIRTEEYPILEDGKCVESYFRSTTKYGKKRTAKIIEALKDLQGVSYTQLSSILEKNDIALNVFLIDGRCIKKGTPARFSLDIVDHNGHMYVSKEKWINQKPDKKENMDSDQFNERLSQVAFPADERYEICKHGAVAQIGDTLYKQAYKNKDTEIEAIMGFRGKYSPIVPSFFDNCGIRAICYSTPTPPEAGRRFDLTKSHRTIMSRKSNFFPVSNGLEEIVDYTGQKIVQCHFYLADLPTCSPFPELFPGKKSAWMLGRQVSWFNSEFDVPLNLTKEFIVDDYARGNNGIAGFANGDVCHYSGVLATCMTNEKTNYVISDEGERNNFLNHYKNSYISSDGVGVSKSNHKKTTGMLAYLAIICFQNLELAKMWKYLGKPKILSIYSDCLGVLNPSPHKSVPSWFKPEQGQHIFPTQVRDIRPITPKFRSTNSLFVSGLAGVGKSYYVRELLENAQDVIFSSTTKENAKAWGEKCVPIQTLLKPSIGWTQIVKNFKGIKTLVIDEASQMTMDIINLLLHLKEATGVRLILIGDYNQCLSVDGVDYLSTPLWRTLCDDNEKTIEYHQHSRFTQEYYDFLVKYLKIAKASGAPPAFAHVRKFLLLRGIFGEKLFEYSAPTSDIPQICWTHKKGESLKGIGLPYQTIHSTQGKTMSELFHVHELGKLRDYRIVYTALSRAKDFNLIKVL